MSAPYLSPEKPFNSREDIEFIPVSTDESSLSNDFALSNADEEAQEEELTDSTFPLTVREECKAHDPFKDRLSFALSVFNLMNVILGSGILGLAETLKNLGLAFFVALLLGTALLAAYMINILLHLSEITNLKTYEGLAKRAFGVRGKRVTSAMIIAHCLGALCSYMYIVKNELPEVLKALTDFHPINEAAVPWYLNGDVLVIIVVLFVITPLAILKDIRFLGYSSAFGMLCMLFFTITVIVKKWSIPCPLENVEVVMNHTSNGTSHLPANIEIGEEQTCFAKAININARTAYALPTMLFSFMCHASMLPIYAELRRPSISRMQRVANISIFNVSSLYILAALFGYLTFYNKVQSELLLTYSLYNSKDVMVILARMMVIICVTLSIPLLHYPCRKTIILTFLPHPLVFTWFRHIWVMLLILTVSVVLVLFVPNIRDIFGMAGATTSTSLLLVFPSAFFIKLSGESTKVAEVRNRYSTRRKVAWVMVVGGMIFMLLSMVLIIVDWLT